MKVGIDIVRIDRMEKLLSRRNENSLLRIWTKKELDESRDKNGGYKADTLAAMFSCKESVAKALGTGFAQGVGPSDIEVSHRTSGEPYVTLHGEAKAYMESLGYKNLSVSLTHSDENAAAVCVMF